VPANKTFKPDPRIPPIDNVRLIKYDFEKYGKAAERRRLVDRWILVRSGEPGVWVAVPVLGATPVLSTLADCVSTAGAAVAVVVAAAGAPAAAALPYQVLMPLWPRQAPDLVSGEA
jgi:hypothetical protein